LFGVAKKKMVTKRNEETSLGKGCLYVSGENAKNQLLNRWEGNACIRRLVQ